MHSHDDVSFVSILYVTDDGVLVSVHYLLMLSYEYQPSRHTVSCFLSSYFCMQFVCVCVVGGCAHAWVRACVGWWGRGWVCAWVCVHGCACVCV
jgi:hypothetical protein